MEEVSRKKLVFVRIGLILGSLLFIIALLEGSGYLYVKKNSLSRESVDPTEFAGYRLYRYEASSSIETPFSGTVLKTNQAGIVAPGGRSYEPIHGSTYRIMMFGGSTVEGRGVSDEAKTIPAVLEAKLHLRYPGKKFEVMNMGVPGYTSFQELLYFKEAARSFAPDMVIFFDGFNDMREGYFGATAVFADAGIRPDFSMRLIQVEDALRTAPSLINPSYLRVHSYFFEAFFSGLGRLTRKTERGSCGIDAEKLEVAAAAAARNHGENISLARAIALDRPVAFRAVLQPTILSKKTLTESEEAAKARLAPISSGRGVISCTIEEPQLFYEYMEDFFSGVSTVEKRTLGQNFADFSGLFQNQTGEVFVDGVHYNDRGNELIVEALVPLLARDIK